VNAWRTRPPLILAHRGASHAAPENSFAAFDLALDEGADGFELDVRLTRDGVPVVMHDRDLLRTTGKAGLVDLLTAREIEAYRIDDAPVPTLAAVFDRYKGRALFDVELKSWDAEQPGLVRAVHEAARRAGVLDDVLVTSFDPFACAAWRETGGLAGLLVGAAPGPEEAALAAASFDALLPPAVDLTAETAMAALNAGALLYVWTVNDPAVARDALALGAHGVITDEPRRIRDALR